MPMPKPSVVTFPIGIPTTYRLPPRIPFKDQNYYNNITPVISANPNIDPLKIPMKTVTHDVPETNKKESMKPVTSTISTPAEKQEEPLSAKCDRYTKILQEFEQRKKIDRQNVLLIKKLQQELLFTTENAKVDIS